MIKDVSQFKLGQAVLLELNSNEQLAPSMQSLIDLIGDIEKRILDARAADQLRDETRAEQCVADILSLKQKRNNTREAIKAKQGQIAETSQQIGRMNRAIEIMKERIIEDRKQLGLSRETLLNDTRQRMDDHAVFVQRVADTDAATEAVAEILGLGWDLLVSGTEDDSSDFQREDWNGTLIALQQKTATMREGVPKSLLLVAAMAASGLDADDVARLKDLLEKLKVELAQYKKDLIAEEERASCFWLGCGDDIGQEAEELQTIRQWEKQLQDDINEKLRLMERRSDAEKAIEEYQEQWSGLKEQYTGKADAPGALEVLLSATELECSTWEENFRAREAARDEELAVIAQIYNILREKVDGYQNGDADKFDNELAQETNYGHENQTKAEAVDLDGFAGQTEDYGRK